MSEMDKWEKGRQLTEEEEPEYLKDLCAYLRNQDTLSEPKQEDGKWVCEIIKDDIAAHTADIIEELLERIQNLKYELRELKANQ